MTSPAFVNVLDVRNLVDLEDASSSRFPDDLIGSNIYAASEYLEKATNRYFGERTGLTLTVELHRRRPDQDLLLGKPRREGADLLPRMRQARQVGVPVVVVIRVRVHNRQEPHHTPTRGIVILGVSHGTGSG